jgi:hypothetical protein
MHNPPLQQCCQTDALRTAKHCGCHAAGCRGVCKHTVSNAAQRCPVQALHVQVISCALCWSAAMQDPGVPDDPRCCCTAREAACAAAAAASPPDSCPSATSSPVSASNSAFSSARARCPATRRLSLRSSCCLQAQRQPRHQLAGTPPVDAATACGASTLCQACSCVVYDGQRTMHWVEHCKPAVQQVLDRAAHRSICAKRSAVS